MRFYNAGYVWMGEILSIGDLRMESESETEMFCPYCGEEERVRIETCHLVCEICGQTADGCGD